MVKQIKRELGTWRGKIILLGSILFFSYMTLFNIDTFIQAKPVKPNIRIIELEIKDMAFGDNNPNIYLLLGETVRFVIKNSDHGMTHEFKIKGTKIKTRILEFGEQDSIIFQAPQTENDLLYICSWHALSMRGNLFVRSEIPAPPDIALK